MTTTSGDAASLPPEWAAAFEAAAVLDDEAASAASAPSSPASAAAPSTGAAPVAPLAPPVPPAPSHVGTTAPTPASLAPPAPPVTTPTPTAPATPAPSSTGGTMTTPMTPDEYAAARTKSNVDTHTALLDLADQQAKDKLKAIKKFRKEQKAQAMTFGLSDEAATAKADELTAAKFPGFDLSTGYRIGASPAATSGAILPPPAVGTPPATSAAVGAHREVRPLYFIDHTADGVVVTRKSDNLMSRKFPIADWDFAVAKLGGSDAVAAKAIETGVIPTPATATTGTGRKALKLIGTLLVGKGNPNP